MSGHRDHGGGIDAACARFGGERGDWLDLSTGINPVPYPIHAFAADAWTALPDAAARDHLVQAARSFWNVPAQAAVLAAPGASSLIARLPGVFGAPDRVDIETPTYNEHAAAFRAQGWQVGTGQVGTGQAPVQVVVHPNNPDGRLWPARALSGAHVIIDESFCDIAPAQSHIARAAREDTVILKSFGKFWGLAGLRLGFAIGAPKVIDRLADLIGPWPVAGPALDIGARALSDQGWAQDTRARLGQDAARLDRMMVAKRALPLGGCDLFRLYEVEDARAWQARLAQGRVWSRIFPYSQRWIRLGLPAPQRWAQLEAAL
ncbi:Threonine-phosphate decarboxylase [Aquimixticola soesokkakensis]|uniref:Aminotransferase n=1 Tax=Aquimixticola soesokkakensis TaxID=1519096 RepID=A0A1Y5RHM0_9RHOB|nr:threonine-phosphate decarboxylase [Aquimixticola soesokkakensis]SLN17621.1 Threonine-phosphate decarboxylase [Aquimixticola soesokkakensis]